VEQVFADDGSGRVVGAWRYDGVRDVWLCESIHQPGREHVAHSEADAIEWVRRTHADHRDG
jgi:hypothetical protein